MEVMVSCIDDLERYDRQMRIPGFGPTGQEKIRKSKVAIVGLGGLGCPQATYLTAAGIGQLTLIDQDIVAAGNLNRQILHWEEDLGRSKVDSAHGKLSRLNSRVKLLPIAGKITRQSAMELLQGHDLVLDGLDNLETRKIVNQACVRLNIPLIYGGITGLTGMVSTIIPGHTACLECLFPGELPPTVFPVLGTTPAIIAGLQVTEAVKYLTGLGQLLTDRLLVYDGLDMTFREISIQRRNDCAVCRDIRPLQ
ncbi:MAG: HesA/MoeB/ThiF family protein [Deltaproteobacteria bacterium]|nr:HesA/MoeB/ThiF family protein [Deltaproteobacteria bacterium]